jgi:hypothetical protein
MIIICRQGVGSPCLWPASNIANSHYSEINPLVMSSTLFFAMCSNVMGVCMYDINEAYDYETELKQMLNLHVGFSVIGLVFMFSQIISNIS